MIQPRVLQLICMIDANEISKIIQEASASGVSAHLNAEDSSKVARHLAAVIMRDKLYREQLIAAIRPIHETLPATAVLLQMRRNATAREEFLRDFPTLTSARVAELSESRAANRAAIANLWKKKGRIFSIPFGRTERFPVFQFDPSGRPWEVVEAVLRALPKGRSGWEVALWFSASNDRLGGKRPVDLIESSPDSVARAAREQFASLEAF